VTPFPWPDLLVIAGLILINGLFSMSEMAIVSARSARLRVAADKGSAAARTVLALQAEPGKFLSTVQIGITLIGILAGAYSGSALGHPVGERLAALGVPARYAEDAGFAVVIAATTYFSLVVGELVPKQLALRIAEPIALLAARPAAWLAKGVAPLVWLLDRSSRVLLGLFGIREGDEGQLTADELKMIFAEATQSGVIEEDERALMTGIMRLAERPVRGLMTPRTELDWIEISATGEELRARIVSSPHSLLPVIQGNPDHVVGVLKVRDALAEMLCGREPVIASLMKKAEVIPDQLDALDAMPIMQAAEVAMALVHDEYGHFEGVVTPADLLAAIVGGFVSHQDDDGEPIIEREDGSLLIAGAVPADVLSDRLGIDLGDDHDYATAAGYVLSVLKQLPHEGEHFTDQGWRFEVVDMDGFRIDKLLVSRVAEEGEAVS
jgi:putative hemolysin